jgi:hypothetical protein
MRVQRKEATRYSKFAKKRAAAQWELITRFTISDLRFTIENGFNNSEST